MLTCLFTFMLFTNIFLNVGNLSEIIKLNFFILRIYLSNFFANCVFNIIFFNDVRKLLIFFSLSSLLSTHWNLNKINKMTSLEMQRLEFFFTHTELFTALYPFLCMKQIFIKRSFKLLFIKSQKISRGLCQKWECKAKKNKKRGDAKRPPPQPV